MISMKYNVSIFYLTDVNLKHGRSQLYDKYLFNNQVILATVDIKFQSKEMHIFNSMDYLFHYNIYFKNRSYNKAVRKR